MELVIATRKWSAWSLRAWLVLKATGAAFTETCIEIQAVEGRSFTPEEKRNFIAKLATASPTARLPVLHDGALTVWDTASIAEYLHEKFPAADLWPKDPIARALARSATAEMHSSFLALRRECRMDVFLRTELRLTDTKSENDVRRMVRLFTELRRRFGDRGPYLVGPWSIADAFVLPEATRLRSYGVKLSDYGDEGEAQEYCDALLRTPDYLEWERLAA